MVAPDLVLLSAATAALVRLDERLSGCRAHVRAGWLARALLHEAVCSARLDEVFVEAEDLLLFEHDLMARLADRDIHAAQRGLVLLRASARRHPRQLFTPRRVMAAARLRFGKSDQSTSGPHWFVARLEERRADPEEMRACLERALDPLALGTFQLAAPLLGAAGFITRWHDSGAADLVGGNVGRALAASWLRRAGLVTHAVPLPAAGFLGHAGEYGMRRGVCWENAFLAASLRSAEWGLTLLDKLLQAERRLEAAAVPQRRSSHLPAVVDLLLATPAVSVAGLARDLGISTTAVRGLIGQIVARYPLHEMTGRSSFRLFGAF